MFGQLHICFCVDFEMKLIMRLKSWLSALICGCLRLRQMKDLWFNAWSLQLIGISRHLTTEPKIEQWYSPNTLTGLFIWIAEFLNVCNTIQNLRSPLILRYFSGSNEVSHHLFTVPYSIMSWPHCYYLHFSLFSPFLDLGEWVIKVGVLPGHQRHSSGAPPLRGQLWLAWRCGQTN